jgi:hypothetical protein
MKSVDTPPSPLSSLDEGVLLGQPFREQRVALVSIVLLQDLTVLFFHDLKSLRALAEEKKLKRYLCVSLGPRRRNLENLTILPLQEFLEALWSREYSS